MEYSNVLLDQNMIALYFSFLSSLTPHEKADIEKMSDKLYKETYGAEYLFYHKLSQLTKLAEQFELTAIGVAEARPELVNADISLLSSEEVPYESYSINKHEAPAAYNMLQDALTMFKNQMILQDTVFRFFGQIPAKKH